MKNFTKQNFKTNPLWIRLLIMAFMLLTGSSSAWGAIYLKGSFNGWNESNVFDGNGHCKITLSKGDYTFKIHDNGSWYGNGHKFNRNDCSNITVNTNTNDMSINVDADGSYDFYWNGYEKKLSITYPQQCTTCCNNNYVAGNAQLTGYDWDPGQNKMTCSNNLYSKTFTNVVAGTHKFKITSGSWNWSTNAITSKSGSNYLSLSQDGGDIKFTTSAVYNITIYFDGNGCYATYESACTPPAAPTLNPNSTTVCSGTSFNLPSGYRWYTVDKGGTKLSSNTISAGVAAKTIYYAEAGEDGCVSESRTAYTVNVNPKPAITLASPSSICTGTEIDLTEDYVTSKTGTVTWYSDANRSQEITNGIVTPINTGTSQTTNTYYAKVTNGVCSAKTDVSLSIKVDPQSAITLKAAPTICNGTTVTFANYVNTHTGTVTWHTKSDFSDAAITSAKPSQTTTYYAKASSGDCTPATASLKVTVNNKPAVPTLSADNTSLVSPNKATLTAGNTTNGLTYTLYNGENAGESQKSTGGNLTFKVGEAGNYTVRVSNSCGTSTSTVVTITVCTPQTNEFRHANSSYTQLANQPTYYPGDKAYFVSTGNCCLTGIWSANLQKGEEGWWTGLTGSTPRFSMTLTRAGEFTITNMATNGCTQDKNVMVDLDFTVTALSQVTNANGTASGADITLTWKHSANHTKVMVVRYPTAGTETIPAGGQSYSAGNTLGAGTVVYVGTSESYTDKNLPSGESYKYYFYTVNNNYYSDGVVLNMSSCPIPAKPSLSSTAITACNGECTAQGYITIGNMGDYKDDTYTFKLGSSVVTPDANGRLGINSTAYTQYTVTVTNSCENSSNAQVDIAINDNTPTISGPTSTLPGKVNAIELTVPTGSDTKWTVNNNGDLSAATGASTMFSAEDEREYTVTANYNGCTDTHIITVANGYTVYLRRPHAKNETTEYNYWFGKSSSAAPGYVKFGTVNANASDQQMYGYNGGSDKTTKNPNEVATLGTVAFTDCEGYVWEAFNIGLDVTALYFRAPNDNNVFDGYATYTRSYAQNTPIAEDMYFTMGDWDGSTKGRTLTKVEKPFEGIEIDALGSTEICSNNMASFAALYLKSNCTGQEITAYAWKFSTDNSSWDDYTTGKGATTNNIRPNKAGYYHLECKLKDGSVVTSNSIQITTTTCSISNASLNNITSNLPIIMVNTGDKAFPSVDNGKHCSASADDLKKKRSVDVKILWNPNGTVSSSDAYTNGANLYYDRKARMNYRGSSSLNFEKKSYAFCPGDENCGQDEDKSADYVKTKKMNMFNIGEAEDKDWVLYAAYVDPSMMRNILAMETYSAMTGKWGVKNQYVELYIDGKYQGVYVFMDKITKNDNRVNIKWKIDKSDDSKSKREFILKFDKTDVADRYEDASGDQKTFESDMTGKTGINTYDTTVDQRFEIEYPEKEDIEEDYGKGSWSEVYSFVSGKVNEFEKALADGDFNKVRNLINYESWADFFILNEFTKNVDAYRASCVFVFKDGKFEAWPLWDYELSFNNTVTGSGKGRGEPTGLLIEHSDVYSDAFPAPFWWTGKYKGSNIYAGLLKDPCFIQMVVSRWAEHTKTGGALHPNTTTTKTAAYKAKLDKNNAAIREFTKWPIASRGKDACNKANTGYFANGGGGSNTSHADSYAQLNKWLAADQRHKGLDDAIKNLAKIIEFGITATADKDETTPWRAVNVKVDAIGAGYTYTVTPAITGGQVIQGDGNLLIYAEETGEYTVVTTLDAKDQCGSTGDNASDTVTFTVNPLQEVCTQ